MLDMFSADYKEKAIYYHKYGYVPGVHGYVSSDDRWAISDQYSPDTVYMICGYVPEIHEGCSSNLLDKWKREKELIDNPPKPKTKAEIRAELSTELGQAIVNFDANAVRNIVANENFDVYLRVEHPVYVGLDPIQLAIITPGHYKSDNSNRSQIIEELLKQRCSSENRTIEFAKEGWFEAAVRTGRPEVLELLLKYTEVDQYPCFLSFIQDYQNASEDCIAVSEKYVPALKAFDAKKLVWKVFTARSHEEKERLVENCSQDELNKLLLAVAEFKRSDSGYLSNRYRFNYFNEHNESEKLTKLLLDNGANPNYSNDETSVVQAAIKNNDPGMVRSILSRGLILDTKLQTFANQDRFDNNTAAKVLRDHYHDIEMQQSVNYISELQLANPGQFG